MKNSQAQTKTYQMMPHLFAKAELVSWLSACVFKELGYFSVVFIILHI